MRQSIVASLVIGCAALLSVGNSTASAAVVTLWEANFDTDGDTEGLVNFSNRLATYEASGGFLAGTAGASGDPQIRSQGGIFGAGIDLGALDNATLEIRATNSTGAEFDGGLSHISFNGAAATNVAGLPIVNFRFTPTAANTLEVFTFDAKSILAGVSDNGGANDNVLRSFRLDPLDAANTGSFQIDYIRLTSVTAIPEPSSFAILGLSAGVSVIRRRRRR